MAVPSSRRRAGKLEIDNKARQIKEEVKKREASNEEKITQEEHEARMKILKDLGLVK
ncbi:MAG: hypothetical protein Q7S74_02980 [Nanoarchaeota archaeon]|nr:hypothetical protein [Nanoarchaeota archaeon]